jgi:hypothetical protein
MSPFCRGHAVVEPQWFFMAIIAKRIREMEQHLQALCSLV